jgi:hypothetical protein
MRPNYRLITKFTHAPRRGAGSVALFYLKFRDISYIESYDYSIPSGCEQLFSTLFVDLYSILEYNRGLKGGIRMRRVLIMGAAGRDFHNFNVFFRNNPRFNVICFTATQIPNIENRKYPRELAGKGYARGIPIFSEKQLTYLVKKYAIDIVVF